MTRLSTLLPLAVLLALTLPALARAASTSSNHESLAGEAGALDLGGPVAARMAIEDAVGAAVATVAADPAEAVRYAALAEAVAAAVTQDAKLTADDAAQLDLLGFSVSLEGDRALIGAPSVGSGSEGAAYVFAYDGEAWSQEAKLIASDAAALDSFGEAVSLSAGRALVGAYRDDDGGTSSGSAYVFAFDGGAWSQEAKLTASDAAANDEFSRSAVSLLGDRALVGSPRNDAGGSNTGAAYVFAFDGGAWSQEAKLTADDAAADDLFGTSVSLADDRALVGAPNDNEGVNRPGFAGDRIT